MNNRSFITLILAAVFVGFLLAGTFTGGLLIGKRGVNDSSTVDSTVPTVPTRSEMTTTNSSDAQVSFAQIRERLQSGELTQEEAQALREQFRNQFPDSGSDSMRGRFGGGRGQGALVGTIKNIEGNIVTVEGSQGNFIFKVSDATVIRQVSDIKVDKLVSGIRINVSGSPDENGVLDARSITLVPESNEVEFGGSQRDGRGRLGNR